MDVLLSQFGENAPKKRLLVIDYEERGADKHDDLAAYQYRNMTDVDLINGLVIKYAKQDKWVTSIVEVDSNYHWMRQLYIAPGFLNKIIKSAR